MERWAVRVLWGRPFVLVEQGARLSQREFADGAETRQVGDFGNVDFGSGPSPIEPNETVDEMGQFEERKAKLCGDGHDWLCQGSLTPEVPH